MLFRWPKRQTDTSLMGLDIASNSIKLLVIKSDVTPYEVTHFACAELPAESIVKGEIKDPAAIANTLQELYKNNNIDTKSVALAISRSSVIIKSIKIDSRLNASEIESRAWIEANHHFPDLVGEIYLDFTVAPVENDTTQLEMTLVACRKDQINPYLEILKEAGLKAKVIDVNTYALERALALITANQPETSVVGLLNLDRNLSSFIVVDKDKPLYAHDHTFDGHRLINKVDEYVKNTGESNASLNDLAYFDILKSGLSAHLRHTLHFFYSSRPQISIQKLIISGDCACIPDLMNFVHKEVGVSPELANPFVGMTITFSENAERLKRIAPTLMLSCGLALSRDKSTLDDSVL